MRSKGTLSKLLVVLGLLVGGLFAVPSQASAATVCSNTDGTSLSRDVRNSAGELIATLWWHGTTTGKGCYVLRAAKWEGTPHYMLLRICNYDYSRCSGEDAGIYSSYAGPIYFDPVCTNARVIVHSPSGSVAFDQRIAAGPCE